MVFQKICRKFMMSPFNHLLLSKQPFFSIMYEAAAAICSSFKSGIIGFKMYSIKKEVKGPDA